MLLGEIVKRRTPALLAFLIIATTSRRREERWSHLSCFCLPRCARWVTSSSLTLINRSSLCKPARAKRERTIEKNRYHFVSIAYLQVNPVWRYEWYVCSHLERARNQTFDRVRYLNGSSATSTFHRQRPQQLEREAYVDGSVTTWHLVQPLIDNENQLSVRCSHLNATERDRRSSPIIVEQILTGIRIRSARGPCGRRSATVDGCGLIGSRWIMNFSMIRHRFDRCVSHRWSNHTRICRCIYSLMFGCEMTKWDRAISTRHVECFVDRPYRLTFARWDSGSMRKWFRLYHW